MLRIHRFTAPAVAIVLCAAAPAAAQQDWRSPDVSAAAQQATPTASQIQDYRSPDAANPVEPTTDLRAPDNRVGQPTGGPAPTRVRIVEVPSSGFGWGDAGIGAAGMLALVLVGVGVSMIGTHRRRARRMTAATR